MHQAILLSLSPTVMYRLIGINPELDRELSKEYFWKQKVERDIDPPYHREIPSYRQYYLVLNEKEYGRIWNRKAVRTDLKHVTKIYSHDNDDYALADTIIYRLSDDLSDTRAKITGVKKYYPGQNLYLDLGNNLRNPRKVLYSGVKELLWVSGLGRESAYLNTAGELIEGKNVIAEKIVQVKVIIVAGIGYALILDNEGRCYQFNTAGLRPIPKLPKIILISGSQFPAYIDFNGKVYDWRNYQQESLPQDLPPIRKVWSEANHLIVVGYDRRNYFIKDPSIKGEMKMDRYEGVIDQLNIGRVVVAERPV